MRLTILILVVLGLVGTMDYHDDQANQKWYQQQIKQWVIDQQHGVDPMHRRGWPPSNIEGR